jgi:hypothetical protein
MNISAKFAKKFEMVLMGYLGVQGKLIHEKNEKLKIPLKSEMTAAAGTTASSWM